MKIICIAKVNKREFLENLSYFFSVRNFVVFAGLLKRRILLYECLS